MVCSTQVTFFTCISKRDKDPHSKFYLPEGRRSHCLYTPPGQLHIDFFFAVGYTYLVGFLSRSFCLRLVCKILCCILTFSKNRTTQTLRPLSSLTFLWGYVFGITSFVEPALHSIAICASEVRLALIPGPWTAWDSGLAPFGVLYTSSSYDDRHRDGLFQASWSPRPFPEPLGEMLSSGPRFHGPGRPVADEDHFYLRTKSRQPASRDADKGGPHPDHLSRLPGPERDYSKT